jgi:Flp pilus assembly protein TadG
MPILIRKQCHLLKPRFQSRLGRFLHDRQGVVTLLVGLAMPVLIGTMGLAAETSYWYMHKRSMQNAADAAAIAAATNASSTYAVEAKAVAANLGFQDGSGNVTVQVANPATAAGCSANCYTVTVSDKVPLFLSEVIGYAGNKDMTAISASAVATTNKSYSYCVLALANFPLVGPVVGITGAVIANLNGCNVISDSNAICLLTNLNANVGDAVGANLGCGIKANSNMPYVADPYSGLDSNIPADPCGGSYPQEPVLILGPALPASNKWSGSKSLSSYQICGDLQLTGNTTINAPGNTLLVIYNGRLDTNGYTLQTASGSGLTVVFTGTNVLGYVQIATGSGTLDIAAPTSGTWSGIAIYQDPKLTLAANINLPALGVGPTWKISGMVHVPYSIVALAGAVNPATNGVRCFGMVVGTFAAALGSIFPNNNQCAAAGVSSAPEGGSRGTLVH